MEVLETVVAAVGVGVVAVDDVITGAFFEAVEFALLGASDGRRSEALLAVGARFNPTVGVDFVVVVVLLFAPDAVLRAAVLAVPGLVGGFPRPVPVRDMPVVALPPVELAVGRMLVVRLAAPLTIDFFGPSFTASLVFAGDGGGGWATATLGGR